jgi:hypothetical protein
MSTFGNTIPGGTQEVTSSNYKQVSKFNLSGTGSVTKISCYLSASGNVIPVRGIIYADSVGDPGALKAVGSEFTVPDGGAPAWYDSTVSPAVNLTAGDYWIGFIAGDTSGLRLYYDLVTNNRKYKSETYSSTPTDPFGTPDATDHHQLSVYVTTADPTWYPMLRKHQAASGV